MTPDEELAHRVAALERKTTELRQALCLAVDQAAGMATFNVNGGIQVAQMLAFPPAVGVNAWLLYIDSQPFCLGPGFRSPWGIVASAPDDGQVVVTGDDGVPYAVPYADSLDLAVFDRVAIDWASGVAVAEPASETVPGDTTGPGSGSGELRTWTFYPTDSGSYGSSWFTKQVYSSDSNIGVWTYGTQIPDTIPDWAVVQSVTLHVDAVQTQGGNPTVGLHGLSAIGPAPSVGSAVAVAGGTGDKALPTSFGDALKVGTSLGVGTAHGGYHIWSAANVNNSGALTIVAQL